MFPTPDLFWQIKWHCIYCEPFFSNTVYRCTAFGTFYGTVLGPYNGMPVGALLGPPIGIFNGTAVNMPIDMLVFHPWYWTLLMTWSKDWLFLVHYYWCVAIKYHVGLLSGTVVENHYDTLLDTAMVLQFGTSYLHDIGSKLGLVLMSMMYYLWTSTQVVLILA